MNYVECIGRNYPNVHVVCIGDPENYADIIWQGGEPLPTEAQLQAKNLENIKWDKWYEIEEERDRRDAESGVQVEVEGVQYWFHTDIKSLVKYLGLDKLASVGKLPDFPPIPWRTMNKTYVVMNGPIVTAIIEGIALRALQIFQVADEHRYDMMESADPANYDYSTGWPVRFKDLYPEVPE